MRGEKVLTWKNSKKSIIPLNFLYSDTEILHWFIMNPKDLKKSVATLCGNLVNCFFLEESYFTLCKNSYFNCFSNHEL